MVVLCVTLCCLSACCVGCVACCIILIFMQEIQFWKLGETLHNTDTHSVHEP